MPTKEKPDEHLKSSGGYEFKCLRCGYAVKLNYFGNEYVGKCEACGQTTIFQRVNMEFERSRYFVKGKFVAKLLADDVMRKHRFITFEDSDEIYYYSDGIYRKGGESLIKKICEEILQEEANTRRVSEVLNHVRRATYINGSEIMDNNPNFLCVENGILDLSGIKDGKVKLLPHNPDMIFLSKIPVVYNENLDCTKIMKFIYEIVRADDVSVLQELTGYCLWKAYPIQKAFVLLGDGSNGKSTFLHLLVKLLGKANVSSVPLHEIVNNRFAAANLYGKLANIYADLPPAILKDTAKFKALTGGDLITAEFKFRDSFQFYNYAKLLFSANRLPITYDDSDAFFRRWVIINFPYKFEGKNADPHILEKLAKPEELSGFLNWALEGLARLLKNGQFSHSKSTEEIRRQYILASDPVHAFVDECLVQDSDGIIPKELLYATFKEYCDENSLPVSSKHIFSRDLLKFITAREQRPKIEGRQERCWAGIKLNEYGMQFVPEELIEKYRSIMAKVATEWNDKDNLSNLSNFLYTLSGANRCDNKIKENMDMLAKADIEWAEMVLKARRGMPREFFINLFMEKRGENYDKEEIGKLYDVVVKKLKEEGYWRAQDGDAP
ncbi:MAG: hypothetical protein J7L58_01285 [Thermoplasmata archaeon]|nr:hypothetical protein [Thermoplasmata archaeon]